MSNQLDDEMRTEDVWEAIQSEHFNLLDKSYNLPHNPLYLSLHDNFDKLQQELSIAPLKQQLAEYISGNYRDSLRHLEELETLSLSSVLLKVLCLLQMAMKDEYIANTHPIEYLRDKVIPQLKQVESSNGDIKLCREWVERFCLGYDLLTLDAWDFIKITGGGKATGTTEKIIPHKWAFYFLMAVGFWNFVGAGIFGFLINMPVVSYFEAGTVLTLNHGHAALLGAFGMLAMALLVLGLRHVSTDDQWVLPQKFVKVSFWGINIGLALMVITNLFPEGILQIWDVLENGYWHARSLEFMGTDRIRLIEWWSMPSHLILILFGVVPMVIASGLTYFKLKTSLPSKS